MSALTPLFVKVPHRPEDSQKNLFGLRVKLPPILYLFNHSR